MAPARTPGRALRLADRAQRDADVAVTLGRHDDAANRRFEETVRALPQVIAADWVTGETDALLMVVAQDVAELQRVLNRVGSRAQRVITLLRLGEMKPASPLPLAAG